MKKYRVLRLRNMKTGVDANYVANLAPNRSNYTVLLQDIQTGQIKEHFLSDALRFKDDIFGYWGTWWTVINNNLWKLLDLIDFVEDEKPHNIGVAKLMTNIGLISVYNNKILLSINEDTKVYSNIIFESHGTCATIFTVLRGLYEYRYKDMNNDIDICIIHLGVCYRLVYDKRLTRFLTKVKVLNKNETSKIN